MVGVKMSEKETVYVLRVNSSLGQANDDTAATIKQQRLAATSIRMAEPNRSTFGKGVPVPSNVTRISSERRGSRNPVYHAQRKEQDNLKGIPCLEHIV
jgi:hypothetical protein